MGTRFIYSQAEGYKIAETRQLAKAGLDNWSHIVTAMEDRRLKAITRMVFVRLATMANLASSARGAQLTKKNAGTNATKDERTLGVKINNFYVDTRKRVKIIFPDDAAAYALVGVGRVPRATDTGGLIDHGQGLLDAVSTKGKTGDEKKAADWARITLAKVDVTTKKLTELRSDLDAIAHADTVQMVTKRMAKTRTSAKDALFAELIHQTTKVREALKYLFAQKPEMLALFEKSTPKHAVTPRKKAAPTTGSEPTK